MIIGILIGIAGTAMLALWYPEKAVAFIARYKS